MKWRFRIFIFLAIFAISGTIFAKHFWHGSILNIEEVGKKWGTKEKFDPIKFKSGTLSIRASMAYDLLKHQKDFLGKDQLGIRKELGDFDGFYFSDMFPAYMVEESGSREKGAWQIVFLLDNKQKVNEIIVHKNCCD